MKKQLLVENVKRVPLIGELAIWAYNKFVFGSPQISINPLDELAAYAPSSGGRLDARAEQTILTAKEIPFALLRFITELENVDSPESMDGSRISLKSENNSDSARLEQLLKKYLSDKATVHSYFEIYSGLFGDRGVVGQVVEIGIGTPNTTYLSNMGRAHRGAGGSLRAWRDFFPNAKILGIDIDPEVMFCEHRIDTLVADQRNFDSLTAALEGYGLTLGTVDLFIDDGLHSPDANLTALAVALKYCKKPGGWIIIEDISGDSLVFWNLVARIFEMRKIPSFIVKDKRAYLFAVRL